MISSTVRNFSIASCIVFVFYLFFILQISQVHGQVLVSSCQTLAVENETYVLTQDIGTNETCFNISASNITLDGNGSTIYANDTLNSATYFVNVSNVDLAKISNFQFNGSLVNLIGVYVFGSNNTQIVNITAKTVVNGIWNEFSNGTQVSNLSVNNSWSPGIYLKDSTSLNLSSLNVTESSQALTLLRVTNTNISSIFTSVTPGSSSSAFSLEGSNLILQNVTRGSGLLTISTSSVSAFVLDSFNITGFSVFSGCSGLTIKNGFIQDSSQPLYIADLSNSLFQNISMFNISGSSIYFSTAVGVNNPSNLTFESLNLSASSGTDISTSNEEGHNGTLIFNNTLLNLYDIYGAGFVFQYKYNNLSVNFSTTINSTGNISSLIQLRTGLADSIYVDENSQFNQSFNLTFFNLLTNYSSEKIFRNGSLCLAPECRNLTPLNRTVVSYTVTSGGNFTISDIGSLPTSTVTSISASSANNNNLTWTWTNPSDIDFNGTLVYVNGTNVINLSRSVNSYTRSSLYDNTQYEISIRTIDYDSFINTTFIGLNSSTTLDSTAPDVVSNFNASVIERDFIFYNWTLPTQEDYAYLQITFDSIVLYSATNITNLTIASLTPNSSHTLTITSFDINANSNATSNITRTLDDTFVGNTITQCGTISQNGTYTVSEPVLSSNYTCLFITASDVILDGNGTSITYGVHNGSESASGIWLSSVSNVTLRNLTIIGNSLLNLSREGVFVTQSSDITLEQIVVRQSKLGAYFYSSTDVEINSSSFYDTNTSLHFNSSVSDVDVDNTLITNASTGFLFTGVSQTSLFNVTISNATLVAINVSSQSHISIDQLNWTLPTNTTSALLLDAQNTTQLTNSSINYGTILFTNISGGNLSKYIVEVFSGNLSLSRRNYSGVNFRLNASAIDTFDLTQAIDLSYNSVFVNATTHPFLNRSAVITFFDMYEGAPVYKLRNGYEFNTTTTPLGSSVTSLEALNPVINTTSLDGNYTLRGYTLKLVSPENSTVLTRTSTVLTFSITPTYNRTLVGCNLSIGSTVTNQWQSSDLLGAELFSYSVSGLVNDTNYTWTVTCLDNLTARVTKVGNFTVSISESSSSSNRRSGAFGSGSGASLPWINTFSRESSELSSPFSITLRLWDGVRIRVNNNSHHVGIIAVTATTVTVNVSSKPQQAVIKVNETKKFIIDENESMGITVTLNSLNGSRANLTISPVLLTLNSNSTLIAASNSSQDLNNTVQTTDEPTPGAYKVSTAGDVIQKFVATKGIIILVVVTGLILVCGLAYYFFLVLKYKQGIKQPLTQSSGKKGLLSEFLFPFMPGGDFWNKKKNEELLAQASMPRRGPKPEDVERYSKTIIPLVPATHADHIEARIKMGNTLAYIEFELIENGYTREQSKSLIQKYQLDQYVKNCVYAGATNDQIRDQLLNSGWAPTIVAKIFRPAQEKEIYNPLSD